VKGRRSERWSRLRWLTQIIGSIVSKETYGLYHILQTIRHTFFLKKLPPKFRCVLYSKLIQKCPVFDLKFPSVLKMAIYSMLGETYLYLATLDSTGSSSAPM
jgi:hypothetical protein